MTARIELANVTKRFGSLEAVRDVSLSLLPGEIVALVGHNGAGKTTLMKLMLGLILPTQGSIRVLNEDPSAGEFFARRRLGFLPESVSFNGALTGREVLTFYARLKRQPGTAVATLLERVGLEAAADRRIGTYSKGMRQRLGLAQALLGEPEVLLLDEPTTGLDPALRMTFYGIVEDLCRKGATILLSSHALTELEERASRIVIMNRGSKVADGTVGDLRRAAQLPTRIRVKTSGNGAQTAPDWLGSAANWRRVNGSTLEIDASSSVKMMLLRELTKESAPVEDVEVLPPTLDDLYAHFLQVGGDTP